MFHVPWQPDVTASITVKCIYCYPPHIISKALLVLSVKYITKNNLLKGIDKYYIHICNPKSKKRLANWGAYIEKLKPVGDTAVKEVVAILQQIKDRHRNLIMHPEIVLAPDEAFTLFEIAQGAIIAMVNALPIPKKK